MFIKSIIIDGFESFGKITHCNDFDPYVNVITGNNGSGKSNILTSAICFLIGSNQSRVQACNLQDLVYQFGTARSKQAMVSITFDNTDMKKCPASYKNHKKITITRKVSGDNGYDKYLINGFKAQNSEVQDLFSHTQTDVNNPHFLISQDHINKVLDMKPPEILSLVEEVTDIKVFEMKKKQVQLEMEKKERKREIASQVIEKEIPPLLNKRREEHKVFLDYTRMLHEIEQHKKLLAAWDFFRASCVMTMSQDSLNEITEAISTARNKIPEYETRIATIKEEIATLEKKKDEVEVAEAEALVEQKKAKLEFKDEDIKKLYRQYEDLVKTCEENNLLIKEKEIDFPRIESIANMAKQRVRDLESQHDWIAEEKQFFGVANTQYDFKQHKPSDSTEALQQLQERSNELSKTIDMGMHSSFGDIEERCHSMHEMKSGLDETKVLIAQMIEKLDQCKKVVLQNSLAKVNDIFGAIFSIFFAKYKTNAPAKLVPSDGHDINNGLEVNWEEIRSELSREEKFLVALSLILALMLFKPAPIYILDKVDAVLDSDQTTNIAAIIKEHFNKSQFIIVSSKLEMFNIANVFFKTEFEAGMPTVTRLTQWQE